MSIGGSGLITHCREEEGLFPSYNATAEKELQIKAVRKRSLSLPQCAKCSGLLQHLCHQRKGLAQRRAQPSSVAVMP